MEKNDHTWKTARAAFTTTCWTLVSEAKTSDSGRAQEALEALCHKYWFPLYAYVRRKGYSHHDAQDLTQGFFEKLIAREFLAKASKEKGKLRSFLLASMNHYLADEFSRSQRKKRGGGRRLISLDQSHADERYKLEPLDQLTPENHFEKQWILTVLETVLNQLRESYVAHSKGDLFDKLKMQLTANQNSVPFSRLAGELEMSEAATRMAASRLRQRYRTLLRQEIASTISPPEAVDEELAQLFVALAK